MSPWWRVLGLILRPWRPLAEDSEDREDTVLRLSLEAGDTRPLEPGDLMDSDGLILMSEAGCRRSRVILMVTTYWHWHWI